MSTLLHNNLSKELAKIPVNKRAEALEILNKEFCSNCNRVTTEEEHDGECRECVE